MMSKSHIPDFMVAHTYIAALYVLAHGGGLLIIK